MQPLTVSKREPKRSRIFLAAKIDRGDGPQDARIRDISRSGALVESPAALEPGEQVRLTCGGAQLDARVAWGKDGCFGLEFETPLLLGSIIDQKGLKLSVSAPRAYRRSDTDQVAD